MTAVLGDDPARTRGPRCWWLLTPSRAPQLLGLEGGEGTSASMHFPITSRLSHSYPCANPLTLPRKPTGLPPIPPQSPAQHPVKIPLPSPSSFLSRCFPSLEAASKTAQRTHMRHPAVPYFVQPQQQLVIFPSATCF